MIKNRLISAILTAVMAAQLFTVMSSNVYAADTTDSGDWTPPLSIADPLPEGDLIGNGHFTNKNVLRTNWAAGEQTIVHVTDDNGGYIKMSDITSCSAGFTFGPTINIIGPGTYKFTGYFRTANVGEISMLRILFYSNQSDVELYKGYIIIDNDWTKAEFYVVLEADPNLPLDDLDQPCIYQIKICGGPEEEFVQEYCVDNFSLVPVDPSEVPNPNPSKFVGGTGGLTNAQYAQKALASMPIANTIQDYDPEIEKEYDVNGIMINHDNTNFLKNVGNNNWTEQDIVNYARQFEGTHVTDYVINVNSMAMLVYSSEVSTDYVEKYHRTEELGRAVDYTDTPYIYGAHRVYDILGTDYVGLWHETFREIGINPWISFRMNDVHELEDYLSTRTPNPLIGDFYYNNPDLRRIKHHEKPGYYGYALNYKYDETREMILTLINDALNRYDTYGVELDYQREICLFGIGGEYEGLDILNEFMRDVQDLVKVYEEKYGHDIKISVRVASDIQTCYDFGLDIVTWAVEDIIDLVIPTGRFTTTDTDMPIRTWVSVMSPYDVEIAPCIEQNIRVSESTTVQTRRQSFTTMTAIAANAFSQGADKISLYNFFRSSTTFTAKKTLNSDFYAIGTDPGGWNLLTTIGSYEKLMTVDRRSILTYNDTHQIWANSNAQLPETVKKNTVSTIRIPVGDVPEGATLTLKFSTSDAAIAENPPKVWVNSETCTYIGMEDCKNGFVSDKLMCYEIPVEAHGGTYMTSEIESTVGFTIQYAEVYLKVAE